MLVFPSLLLMGLLWLRFRPQPIHDPSTTDAASSPPSTSTPNGGSSRRRNEYKVFLSFRGEDTRLNFVSHLYKELEQKGICTFKDDPKLKRGDSLAAALVDAISSSSVAVVVLSEHYASSRWCLKELVKIMDCQKTNGQRVIPIFYNVDPSDVRNHKGSFGKDLEEHKKKSEAEMEKWRNALTQVATISGWDSRDRNEANLIECIVRDISDRLACATSSNACDDLVAIGSQVATIEKQLLEVKREVSMLGIWGLGGIGKTTLAKVLYDKISSQYQACCFIGNVKDKFESLGATSLRKELLFQILKERDLDIFSLDKDSSMIKDRLSCKKVLIVLDDVDQIEQLEVLANDHNWFGVGSTIIITTRDKRLLDEHEVDAMYKVKCLKNDEALQLFSRHAFKQNQIKEDYKELANDFVSYTQGLPLALKVLGCCLHNRRVDFWKDELQILRSTSKKDIFDVLKVSYDGLEDNEKNVFLDIACFLNQTGKNELEHILKGSCLYPDRAFPILIEKSLISIQENFVYMHELLQDVGRDIVRRESQELGKRSRLWDYKDVHYVLTNKKGTEMIKGISLKLSEVVGQMNLEENAFMGMERLRFLKVYWNWTKWGVVDDQEKLLVQQKLHFSHCALQMYTNELGYLRWDGYPLKSLPSGFCARNLVEFNLPYSKVETLWEGVQEFVNLRIFNLQGSNCLVRIPDLSKAQNIVQINLQECESLVEVHSSVQYLDKLERLVLYGCTNLEILPSRLDSNVLTYFHVGGCRKVKKCPEFGPYLCLHPGDCENHSHLRGKPILDLSGMKALNLSGCNFKSLTEIFLWDTSITELSQSIEDLTLLKGLSLFYCDKLESLPANLHRLSSLSRIYISGCKRLRSIPKLPPLLSIFEASYCESLENFLDNSRDDIGEEKNYWFEFEKCFKLSEKAYNNILSFAESIFQKCKPYEVVRFILPGREIPRWICEQAVGSSTNVRTPSNFAAVICCLVFNGDGLRLHGESFLECECQFKGDNENHYHIEHTVKCDFASSSEDEMVVFNLKKPEALDCAVVNELSFKLWAEPLSMEGPRIEMRVKKCGISFVGGNRLRAPPQQHLL